jgi:predicted ABC-type ATPase
MNLEHRILLIAGPNGAGKTTFAKVFLPDAEMAVQRVAQGRHAIPEAVIRRRFSAGLLNFHQLYKPLVNAWALYDNSGDLPTLISSGDNP